VTPENKVARVYTSYHYKIESAGKLITDAKQSLNTTREDALQAAKEAVAARHGAMNYANSGKVRPVLYSPDDYDNSAPRTRTLGLAWATSIEADVKSGPTQDFSVLVDIRSGNVVHAESTVDNSEGDYPVQIRDQKDQNWAGPLGCFKDRSTVVCDQFTIQWPNRSATCADTSDPDAGEVRYASWLFDDMIWDWLWQRDRVSTWRGVDYRNIVDVPDNKFPLISPGNRAVASWRQRCHQAKFSTGLASGVQGSYPLRVVAHEIAHGLTHERGWSAFHKKRSRPMKEHYSEVYESFWKFYEEGKNSNLTQSFWIPNSNQAWDANAIRAIDRPREYDNPTNWQGVRDGLLFPLRLATTGPPSGGTTFNGAAIPTPYVEPHELAKIMWFAQGSMPGSPTAEEYVSSMISSSRMLADAGFVDVEQSDHCLIRNAFLAHGWEFARNGDDSCNNATYGTMLSADQDEDGRVDDNDNCPNVYNPENADLDADGQGDACDSDVDGDGLQHDPSSGNLADPCPDYPPIADADNPSINLGTTSGHRDVNSNGIADACEDVDGDGFDEGQDNCPYTSNTVASDWTKQPIQLDLDADGIGDACDTDTDGDGNDDGVDACPKVVPLFGASAHQDQNGDGGPDACFDPDADGVAYGDNCPETENRLQLDADRDGVGDACQSDDDSDGVDDGEDNCRTTDNPVQLDDDDDGVGDACDNCVEAQNPTQADTDLDGKGNLCDWDDDNDGIHDTYYQGVQHGNDPCTGGNNEECDDNCPLTPNHQQADSDEDGVGDACESVVAEIDVESSYGFSGSPSGGEVDLSLTPDDEWPANLNSFPIESCTEGSGGDCLASPGIREGYRRILKATASEPFRLLVVDEQGVMVTMHTSEDVGSGYEATAEWKPDAGAFQLNSFAYEGTIELHNYRAMILPLPDEGGSDSVVVDFQHSYSY
jgi:hypothetical protein